MPTTLSGTRRLIGSCVLASVALFAAAASAQTTPAQDPHRKEDIAKHRVIAAAHEAAARCLEKGEKEATCHEALRKACQGVAVGKYCGMRHSH